MIIKWISRIIALCLLGFVLPFYFGYGNPLPFSSPTYSIWENVSLLMLPLIFLGLILGWRYPKFGGLMIIFSSLIITIGNLLVDGNLSVNFLISFIPGILYLISSLKSK